MADSKKTKLFTSDMPGAPVLSGTAGSLIAVLDAVLVNGFGLVSVTDLTVTGGIATATVSAGHSLQVDSVGLIAGATPAGLNGEKRILSIAGNSFTFDATGIADQTATGTITAKVASAGWTKAFSGTNLAAYKITAPEGTGFYLRVDDTGTTVARVRGYETMSDVNTGTGPFPTTADFAGSGLWWSKSNTTDTNARPWRIAADDRGFYYFPKQYTSFSHQGNYFGDILSLKSNDPYACVLRGNNADRSTTQGGTFGDDLVMADSSRANGGLYIARAANTLGGAVNIYSAPVIDTTLSATHVTGSVGFAYPAAVDNGLMLTPVVLHNTMGFRGYLPGIRYSPQVVNAAFNTGDVVAGSGDMAGKKVTAVRMGDLITAPTRCGMVFIDHTSDWRV